jgi:hypothetical protein
MKTPMNSFLALLLILTTAFSACKEQDDIIIQPEKPEETPHNVAGKVTEIGTPVGVAETALIGPAGGSFTTSDKRVKIEVPSGAFSSDQTVAIQPITNTNGPGKGLAYRITPYNVTFAKAVKITFHYTEDELNSSFPEALGIAYQDKNRIWQAVGVSQLDATNRTVSVQTTHFSDWSLFTSLDLHPDAMMVNPGETIELQLFGYFGQEMLVPMVPGEEAPIADKTDLTGYVKGWTLAGAGVLRPNGAKATYTAPSVIPAVNPVAITLEVDLKQKSRYFLVRNLFIGRPGIFLKLNNGDYFHMDGEVRYLAPADMSVLGGGTVIGGQHRAISIHWLGKINRETFLWTLKNPVFNYNTDGRYIHQHFYKQEVSPGKLTITGYGEVNGYVSGTFYLEGAGLLDGQPAPGQDPWLGKSKIEGYFRVKRVQ